MPEIITDISILHKISEPIQDNEISKITEQLVQTLPADALGLAAPQIGIHKRVFVANLSTGQWVFLNPRIIRKSSNTSHSIEGCLSLPGVQRCVSRHVEVDLECDTMINLNDPKMNKIAFTFKYQDAFIVQHETDHLDGILLTNLPEIKSPHQKYLETQKSRTTRIKKARTFRSTRKSSPPKQSKISSKKATRLKKDQKKQRKQERSCRRKEEISVKIQERYNAEQKGLFEDNKDPDSLPINDNNTPDN